MHNKCSIIEIMDSASRLLNSLDRVLWRAYLIVAVTHGLPELGTWAAVALADMPLAP